MHPRNLLNLLSPTAFWCSLYKIIFCIKITSSANRDNFASSFWFWCLLFLFLVQLPLLGHPVLCRIKVVEVGFLVLFLILEENLSAFHHWVWCYLWACPYMAFIMLRYVSFILILLRVFITKGNWVLSNAFATSVEMTHWWYRYPWYVIYSLFHQCDVSHWLTCGHWNILHP